MACCLAGLPVLSCGAQELYVFTEPASNIPARSILLRGSAMYMPTIHSENTKQRYGLGIQAGVSKKLMVAASLGMSDMHQSRFIFESAGLYAKWRFFSQDDIHKHFRMAAFGKLVTSRNHLDHAEINLNGDQSGAQVGVVATKLLNRLAVSGSASYVQVLTEKPKINPDQYPYQSFQYTLSAGYLVLPLNYSSYRQTNLNLYCELLGMQNLDKRQYAVDIAPAAQLVLFGSTTRLNVGGRFQVAGNMYRLGTNSLFVSLEYYLLNAWKK